MDRDESRSVATYACKGAVTERGSPAAPSNRLRLAAMRPITNIRFIKTNDWTLAAKGRSARITTTSTKATIRGSGFRVSGDFCGLLLADVAGVPTAVTSA